MQHIDRSEQALNAKRIIVKIGSSLLTNDGKGLCEKKIYAWAADIAKLAEAGRQIILVSSGSIAAGLSLLNIENRPAEISQLQALAAIGQMQLVQTWRKAFGVQQMQSAQVLLTHADLANRTRYLNAKLALEQILAYSAIAIINENDTVATEEIKLGDNDTLAAMVANLLDADLVILLTDQQGIFTADPRKDKDAKLIEYAPAEDKRLLDIAGDAGKLGKGGMRTKVLAAQIAAKSATHTIIANGKEENIIYRLSQGENIGSFLYSEEVKINARKRWILTLNAKGKIFLDSGAKQAVLHNNKSILPVGITFVNGDFKRGDCIEIFDAKNQKIALGISSYAVEDLAKIIGKSSTEIEQIFTEIHDKQAVHKDNLVLL